MNRFVPNSREAGAVAILLALVILIFGGLFVGKEMVDARLLEVEAKTTEADALRRRLQMPAPVQAGPVGEDVFLEGANYSLAANSLQQRLVGTIESNGGKLVSVSIEQPNTPEQAQSRRVVVQATSELENDGLQIVLHELESGRPLLLVDSLTVRRPPTRREGEDDSKAAPKLTVELRVVGFYRRAAAR